MNRYLKKKYLIALALLLVIVIPFVVSLFPTKPQSPSPIVPSPTSGMLPPPTQPINTSDRVARQIIVKFKQTISQQTIEKRLKELNVSIISENEQLKTTLLRVPQNEENKIIQILTDEGLVEYAEPNFIQKPFYRPNDSSVGLQWGLEKIHAFEAWDITKGSDKVKIAIVDSGSDIAHSDLRSKIAGTKGSVVDDTGHGTHVSGIAAAATHNAEGVAGACPLCKLTIAKTEFTISSTAEAIVWAADQGAKVINLSLGGPQRSHVEEDAINYAWSKGALPVAAVPNEIANMEYVPSYPSGYTNVLSVTNTNSSDQLSLAGFGKNVWVGAPGEGIYSTVPGSYAYKSGTSMATPLVSGVAGLIFATSCGKSPAEVRQRICDTAEKINGTGVKYKCGRLDARKALEGCGNSSSTIRLPVGVIPNPACLGNCPDIQVPPYHPSPPPAAPSTNCLGNCPNSTDKNK